MKNIFFIFLFIAFQFTMGKTQAIPNGNFESWTNVFTFEDPLNWITPNMGAYFQGCSIPVNKTTDAYSGSYAIEMTTLSCNSSDLQGLASCVFPFTQKPAALKGYYKCSSPSTNAVIVIGLSKYDAVNDSTIDVGVGYFFPVPTNSYTLFYAPIIYQDTISPDTAVIDLISGENAGNWLKIDSLSFFSSPTIVDESGILPAPLLVFPNPSNGLFSIRQPLDQISADVTIEIYNTLGELILSKKPFRQTENIDLSTQPKGIHFLRMTLGDKMFTGKLIVTE